MVRGEVAEEEESELTVGPSQAWTSESEGDERKCGARVKSARACDMRKKSAIGEGRGMWWKSRARGHEMNVAAFRAVAPCR